MDLEAHSYEVHMKSYIHHFTWNLFELHKNLLLNSYELHMKFMWLSYEFHMKWNRIHSYEIRMGFKWTSDEFHMKWNQIYSYEFTCISYEQFIWTSYGRTNEVNMLYPCNTNEVDLRLINSCMKYIWSSFEFRMIELHKNYMTSAREVPLYYTWIWFLASLPCTSYEWASRSIVRFPPVLWQHLITWPPQNTGAYIRKVTPQ